jgi:hypothetical protein
MLDMSVALAILVAVILLVGPFALAIVVFVRRERLRRSAEELGLTDMTIVYGVARLEGPAGTARSHSVGWAISEMLARFGPFPH